MAKRQLELEQALKESVSIVAEREEEFVMIEAEREKHKEKIYKLQQRNLSLKNANYLRCSACQNFKSKLELIKNVAIKILSQRQQKLQQLLETKQELLESLISEKDAQIGIFEVTGVKTQEQMERLDRLRSDRCQLNRRLKIESENAIDFLSDINRLETDLQYELEEAQESITDNKP